MTEWLFTNPLTAASVTNRRAANRIEGFMAGLRRVAIDDDILDDAADDPRDAEIAAAKAERDAALALVAKERETRVARESELGSLTKTVESERQRTVETGLSTSKAEADRPRRGTHPIARQGRGTNSLLRGAKGGQRTCGNTADDTGPTVEGR